MDKRTVILVCAPHLFGESLENLLRSSQDIRLIGPWELSADICDRLTDVHPDVVVIAEDGSEIEQIVSLTDQIMHRYPDLPVIRVGVNQNVMYIINTQALPARGSDLLKTIRELRWHRPDGFAEGP